MKDTCDIKVIENLFKLSDIYNAEKVEFSNTLGEELFGKIISNRVVNICYDNLKKEAAVIPSEFDLAFRVLCENNIMETKLYQKAITYISTILKSANFPYALLKGAFLIKSVYPEGYRQSNDIDILIEESNVESCQQLLLDNGFTQGYKQDKKIVKATRKDIILSKMNYGETVPFCKLWEGYNICVDINFSLDYKPMEDNKIICNMLDSVVEISTEDIGLRTLNVIDFIIHLCLHLYKEATTYDWVKRRKDLNLYKFSDLNVMLHEYVDDSVIQKLINRIKEFGVERESYYAIGYTFEIYPNLKRKIDYEKLLEGIRPKNLEYLNQIIDPIGRKLYRYDMKFVEWFACENRLSELSEVH